MNPENEKALDPDESNAGNNGVSANTTVNDSIPQNAGTINVDIEKENGSAHSLAQDDEDDNDGNGSSILENLGYDMANIETCSPNELDLDKNVWIEEILEKKKVLYKLKPGVLVGELGRRLESFARVVGGDSAMNGETEALYIYDKNKGVYAKMADDALYKIIVQNIPESMMPSDGIIRGLVNTWVKSKAPKKHDKLINEMECLINTKRGLLDINTWTVSNHTPNVLSTMQLNAYFDLNADGTETEKYLAHVTRGNEEVRQLLLTYFGLVFSNIKFSTVSDMKFCLHFEGGTDGGKTTLVNNAIHILGTQNVAAVDLSSLQSDSFVESQMFGKRLVVDDDMASMSAKETNKLKKSIGNALLRGNRKCKNDMNFTYEGFFVVCSNGNSKFGGDINAILRRFVQIKVPSVTGPLDGDLPKKLKKENNYFFTQCMLALKSFLDGGKKFKIPDVCIKAREQHRIELDSVLRFVDECTIPRPSAKLEDVCTAPKVFKIYKEWCKDNVSNGYNETTVVFKDRLSKIPILDDNGHPVQYKDENLTMATKSKTNGDMYYVAFTLNDETKKAFSFIYGSDPAKYNPDPDIYDPIVRVIKTGAYTVKSLVPAEHTSDVRLATVQEIKDGKLEWSMVKGKGPINNWDWYSMLDNKGEPVPPKDYIDADDGTGGAGIKFKCSTQDIETYVNVIPDKQQLYSPDSPDDEDAE